MRVIFLAENLNENAKLNMREREENTANFGILNFFFVPDINFSGCWPNNLPSGFEIFAWFYVRATRSTCGGSHIQFELFIEASTLWEGCCLVFSKKKRRND